MWVIVLCSVLALGVCLPLFLRYKVLNPFLAASFKTAGTLCALIPALIAAIRISPVFWLFAAALTLHAVGDFVLEFWFEAGAGCFLLGHICYIIGFLRLYPFRTAHLILLAVFLVWLFLILRRRGDLPKAQKTMITVYGCVLSVFAAFGIAGGSTSYSLPGLMVVLGAALFYFSDHMILFRLLQRGKKGYDTVIMVTYYLSQLLLGASCLLA